MCRRNYTEKVYVFVIIKMYILQMTLHNHWSQKYNEHFEKLNQNCLNKSVRNCIQQGLAKVSFMELPRYTNSQ